MIRHEFLFEDADFESVRESLLQAIPQRNINPHIPTPIFKIILEQQTKPQFGQQLISKDITFPAMVPGIPTSGPWTLYVKDFNTDVDFMIFHCDNGDEADTVKFIGEHDPLYVSETDFNAILEYLVLPADQPGQAEKLQVLREIADSTAGTVTVIGKLNPGWTVAIVPNGSGFPENMRDGHDNKVTFGQAEMAQEVTTGKYDELCKKWVNRPSVPYMNKSEFLDENAPELLSKSFDRILSEAHSRGVIDRTTGKHGRYKPKI